MGKNKCKSVKGCTNDRFSHGYCGRHQDERTDEKYLRSKPAHNKFKKKATGEKDVFQEIAAERPHVCQSCGESLQELSPANFSHVIRKSRKETLRLNKKNVYLECLDCHYIWDNGTWEQRMEMKSWDDKLEIIKELDPEYYGLIQLKIKNFTKN
jgi:hypothetical protein